MNFLEAFLSLDTLNESTANEYVYLKNIAAEITELQDEIFKLERDAQRAKQDISYEHTKELDAKIAAVRKRLHDLIDSYTHKKFYGYDEDGHADIDTWEDEEAKAKVAEEEAAIRAEIDELRKGYTDLLQAARAEFEDKHGADMDTIEKKRSSLTSKKSSMSDTIEKIKQQQAPEIERLCKILEDAGIKTFPNSLHVISDRNERSKFLAFYVRTEEFKIELDDIDIEIFDEDGNFEDEKVLEYIEQSEPAYEIFYALDTEDPDPMLIDSVPLVDIPGSDWKVLNEPEATFSDDVKLPRITKTYYFPGNYYEPEEYDYDVEGEIKATLDYWIVLPL